jgi:hypothetical protein
MGGNYNKSLFPFFQFSRYKSELQQRKEENTSVGTVLDTTDTARSVSFLDPHIVIDSEGRLRTKHYDKSDDFNFPHCVAVLIYILKTEKREKGIYYNFQKHAPGRFNLAVESI